MVWDDKRYAEEYDRRLIMEGYPGDELDIILSELGNAKTVIDCGAGSGFYAVPLAEAGFYVEAVEPSAAMSALMLSKLPPEKKLPLKMTNTKWQDWSGANADALIAVHVMYSMGEQEPVVKKMTAYADKVIIITSDESRQSETVINKIREAVDFPIKYKEPVNMEATLMNLKARYRKLKHMQKRVFRFDDIDKEADYYAFHLRLGNSHLPLIRDVLEANSVKSSDGYVLDLVYYDEIYILE